MPLQGLPFFFKLRRVEVFALRVSTFSFGDVIVAAFPVRGGGLSKILGLPWMASSLTPRSFGSGVGVVWNCATRCFHCPVTHAGQAQRLARDEPKTQRG